MVVPTPTSWSLSLSVSDTALKRTSWRSILGDGRYVLRPASRLGSGAVSRRKRAMFWKCQKQPDSITIRRKVPKGGDRRELVTHRRKAVITRLRDWGVHRRRSSISGELGSPGCNSTKPSGGLGQQSSGGQLRTWQHIQALPDCRINRKRVRVQRGSSFMFLAESCGYEPRATSQSAVGGEGWSW